MNRQKRQIQKRRHGFSLIEISIALLILGCILSAFWLAMGSGMRGFYQGTSNVTALQDALVLMETLEMDIDMMVIPPSVQANPVQIANNGNSIRFAIPDFGKSDPSKLPLLDKIPTKWVEYRLVEAKNRKGIFHPVRNSKTFQNIDVLSWKLAITENAENSNSMQFLELQMKIDGIFQRKSFVLNRRKELIAASLSSRYSQQYSQVIELIEEPSN